MGIEQIRAIKMQAGEPKIKKAYSIPRISEKRKQRMEQDKDLANLDREFYLEVWNASPHVCQCGCGAKLGKEMQTIFMHHLLPKSKYPQFRHLPEVIAILAPNCHTQVEIDISKRPVIKKRRDELVKLLLK